jgi:hypothetical protein
MKKSLLFTGAIFLFTVWCGKVSAQQLDLNGDIISGGKPIPNNIMVYTPCPTLTAIDSTYNAKLCGTYMPGWSTMNASGGPSPYQYTWYKPTIGYTPIGLPAISSTYTAMQARGFWFTSPTNTVITGLRVPTDIGTANQFVYVVRYYNTPPTYPTQNSNYTVLGKFLNVPGLDTIKCGIPIYTGDIIGVLGVRGSTAVSTASMSYAPGGYATTISGNPVTLYRFMSQTDITTNPLGQLCEGGTGSLARVDMFFGSSISLVNFAGNLSGGNYVCFYADTNGCTSSSTVNVIPAGTITATSSFTNPTCSAGNNGSALVMPAGGYGTYSYSWSPSGGTSQLATGLSVGSYTCMITDSLGNCASKVVTLGSCTGINSQLSSLTPPLNVHPNPSPGLFNVVSAVGAEIEIYNSVGSKIYIGKVVQGKNNPVNLSEQPEGIYYLRIKDSRSSFKIIKN